MSTKRLNADEHATYLIGLAVRRQLDEGPRDSDTIHAIAALLHWLWHWLDEDELLLVAQETGYLIGTPFEDALLMEELRIGQDRPIRLDSADEADDPDDPDIPF